jgi:hypothetical protein
MLFYATSVGLISYAYRKYIVLYSLYHKTNYFEYTQTYTLYLDLKHVLLVNF